jgi:hypothetical protein
MDTAGDEQREEEGGAAAQPGEHCEHGFVPVIGARGV